MVAEAASQPRSRSKLWDEWEQLVVRLAPLVAESAAEWEATVYEYRAAMISERLLQ